MENLMSTLPNEAPVNPFIPPPLKDTILKRIEKRQYRFQRAYSYSAITNEGVFPDGRTINNRRGESGVARRPAPKEKVVDLSSWMVAWNSYVQAYLHFKPHMFYLLFSYQRIFCRFASTYKFEDVYAYDKDVRMLIASQTTLLPAQRTVAWDGIHNESMSMYMKNNVSRTSGPVCYSCKVPGHYASACPQKNNRGHQREEGVARIKPSFYKTQNSYTPDYPGDSSASRPQQSFFKKNNEPCPKFNRSEPCSKPPCTLAHQFVSSSVRQRV